MNSWQQALNELPKAMRQMPRDMAEEAVELTRQTFETETDPHGAKWAPLKLRTGRILQKTAGLKNSIHAKASGKRFTIGVGKSYASYPQRGTGIYGPRGQKIRPLRAKALGPIGGKFFRSVKGSPRRAMIPYLGMPAKWASAFSEVAEERIGKRLVSTGGRSAGGGRSLVGNKLAGFKRSTSATALLRKAYNAISEE
jgi:phage gpG-like protein